MKPRAPRRTQKPTVVVAGDVCIDWLSVPVAPLPVAGARATAAEAMNWQLREGRHMYAVRGGAWLTADFVAQALGEDGQVLGPQALPHLEKISPDDVIHSMIWLGQRKDGEAKTWVVERFDGFAGPAGTELPRRRIEIPRDDKHAAVVVLDDAGNEFRRREAWPSAIQGKASPWVLFKVRSPLTKGRLWEHLQRFHLKRTIVLLSADDLRLEGANIGKRLSWERTATDAVACLARDPKFKPLGDAAYCIVTLGMEGAVLVKGGTPDASQLWYRPDKAEGQTLAEGQGQMSGLGSIFSACIAAGVAKAAPGALDAALSAGIQQGLESMARLLKRGFGPVTKGHAPAYPLDAIDTPEQANQPPATQAESNVKDVELPLLPSALDVKANHKYRAWRILDSKWQTSKWSLAKQVVYFGLKKVIPELPVGRFGRLEVIDRSEIESYRGIRNLIREFIRNPKPERPLSLAAFGPPGAGKSFGVKQVASSVAGKDADIEVIEFNLSQWEEPHYLAQGLHRVRDIALRGKVPLVFFDEFDSRLGSHALGWLKYFLAPMQDGVFSDGTSTHQIGEAIFVFAGGTARTFAEFEARQHAPKVSKSDAAARTGGCAEHADADQAAKDAKLPDFLSRLRGHVDVFGFSPPCDTNLVRRAVLLRTCLLKKCPALNQSDGPLRIDERVVRAFLQVPDYRHGARSMEAIIDMSSLEGCTYLDPSHLPPHRQLELHVDGRAFLTLLSPCAELEVDRDVLARKVHDNYVAREMKKPKAERSTGSLVPWEKLSPLNKTSNYEQVSFYPTILAAAGCTIAKATATRLRDPNFEFSPEETDRLARMEHERWMEERRIKQPDHPDLKPWDQLPDGEKEKDLGVIAEIPDVLAHAGLRVVRAT